MLLPDPTAVDDWSAEITEDAVGEMNGKISVYDPTETVDVPYDPVTGQGGETTLLRLLDQRPARIQQLKTPQVVTGVDQNTTKRVIRFQIELRADDPIITTGLTVRVDDGGKNKQLEQFAYTVQSSVNSSHAALRTVEAISELAPVPAVP